MPPSQQTAGAGALLARRADQGKGEDTMREKLDAILQRTRESLEQADRAEPWRTCGCGPWARRAKLTGLLRGMGQLPAEERPKMGAMVNEVRRQITQLLDERKRTLAARSNSCAWPPRRWTSPLPGKAMEFGRIHPLRQVQRDLEAVFTGMGFTVEDGPEVELDYYNFEMMNIRKITRPGHTGLDLHQSADSAAHPPRPPRAGRCSATRCPSASWCPVRCIAMTKVDATHSPIFHQMEGVGRG